MYPFCLGIDLHLKRTYMVLLDGKGKILDKRRISNQEITKYLQEKVPQETYAVLEATRNWLFMYDLLNEHVQRVELVHAKGVRAIANAAVKTDQIDASTLVHLDFCILAHHCILLTEVHFDYPANTPNHERL